MPKKHIVILGAGVIGLTTATLLQQEKEFEVTVIARHFPGDLSIDYTSPWAGAHWRSYATNDDSRLIEYEKKTFHHFWNLAKASKNNSGIMIVDGFDYWDRLPDDFSEPWFKDFSPEYRHLDKEELPIGVEFGITYKTVTINAPVYLNYLLHTFLSLGGTTQRANLSHLYDCIKNDTDIVINCSGIHSRTLGGVEDTNVYAAKGQTVVVQLPRSHVNWTFERYSSGCGSGGIAAGGIITYVVPRDNGEVLLGGTYVEHDYSPEPDLEEASAIVQRCLSTRPDLLPHDQTNLVIKKNCVGLRPCRKGGMRIDAEWIYLENFEKKILIVHNYGHGCYGFQSSYGAALDVVKIINSSMFNSKI
ncbi:nucleotide-binding domain-containing protein [Gigaspora margarita]|uniref:Nucleotide-binding domain-containing protein n=2 Tax=Gigaspora margarita TaxID=4874 RepID=A0A8H3X5K1_GIGMA|nr:nucleotide-binding domain-containing protein [Gigaspora margarita]